jgi:hypothetical protein
LKIFTVAAVFGLLVMPQAGHSEEKAGAEANIPKPGKISPDDQAARSAGMAKEAQEKAELLERTRDRKMRAIAKGICTGC